MTTERERDYTVNLLGEDGYLASVDASQYIVPSSQTMTVFNLDPIFHLSFIL